MHKTPLSNRIEKIKDAIIKSPYRYYFLIVFLAYIGLNIWINELYVTGFGILLDYRTSFLIPFLTFNVLIALLTPLTINLSIMKFRDLRSVSKSGGSASFLGIFAGVLGGACPGCFAGFFPAFVGLFGVTATLGNLPFLGLEIQVAAIALLILSIWLLTRDTVCKVDFR